MTGCGQGDPPLPHRRRRWRWTGCGRGPLFLGNSSGGVRLGATRAKSAVLLFGVGLGATAASAASAANPIRFWLLIVIGIVVITVALSGKVREISRNVIRRNAATAAGAVSPFFHGGGGGDGLNATTA